MNRLLSLSLGLLLFLTLAVPLPTPRDEFSQLTTDYIDWSSDEYTDGYKTTPSEEFSTDVFSNYQKQATFLLYTTSTVTVYSTPSTRSTKVGSFSPRLFEGTERIGDWFKVKTSSGTGWLYDESNVLMREIESTTALFKVNETVSLYSQPFTDFKKSGSISSGATVKLQKKSGDWYLTSSGWFKTTKGVYTEAPLRLTKSSLTVSGRTLPVIQSVVKMSPNVRPAYPLNPRYITVHNTDNTSRGANAKAHANYLNMQAITGDRYASWHYTVDDREAYQHLPLNENGWHAGDGDGPGNRSSIGIEITMNSDGNYTRAQENAAYLTAALLIDWNVRASEINQWVFPHRAWSGKNCPSLLFARDGGFTKFLGQVRTAYTILAPSSPTPTPVENNYELQVQYFIGLDDAKDNLASLEKRSGWKGAIVNTNSPVLTYVIETGCLTRYSVAQKEQKALQSALGLSFTIIDDGAKGYYLRSAAIIGPSKAEQLLKNLGEIRPMWLGEKSKETGSSIARYRITVPFTTEAAAKTAQTNVKSWFNWNATIVDKN